MKARLASPVTGTVPLSPRPLKSDRHVPMTSNKGSGHVCKRHVTRDIEDYLRDIYGAEASASLISRITDKLMLAVAEW